MVAGGGGYPEGEQTGKTIARGAGLLQATQHARRMNEGRMPGSAGETLATPGRRPFPHNPQDTAIQENPCRSPALRAMSLSGGVRQACAGRSAVVRAVEITSRIDGRAQGPVAQAARAARETPENSRMQHPPTTTPTPADKNCHHNGNPSHKLSTPGRRSWGWNRADPYR